jgi:hypothetical protein
VFGGDLEVILGNLSGEKARFQLKDLLPYPFDARLLGLRSRKAQWLIRASRSRRPEALRAYGGSSGFTYTISGIVDAIV